MKKLIAVGLLAACLSMSLSACNGGADTTDPAQPTVNKYAHMLEALAAVESHQQGDDALFTPGAGPAKAAKQQNRALGWSPRSEFRFVEVHTKPRKSCIVSADAYLVTPERKSFEEPLDYYVGDGTTCSYDRAHARVVYRFVTITNDVELKYRAVKGADLSPKRVKVPMLG